MLEAKNMRDLCPPPTIDGLIVVAHNAEASMRCSKQLRDLVLAAIGVLIFVDHNMVEPSRLFVPDVVKILQ